MIDVKALLTKILTKLAAQLQVKTVTVSGTTNGSGAIFLGSVPVSASIISVKTASNANYMCIPWIYNNSNWYCKVVDWQNLASQNNKSVSLTIKYIS